MAKIDYKKYDALAYVAPTSGKDPIDNFIEVGEAQIAKIEDAIKLRDNDGEPAAYNGKFNPRADWVLSKAGGYVVKWSRFQIATPKGTKQFKVDTLEEALDIVKDGVNFARTEDEFKQLITEASNKLKAAQKAGKPKGKK